MKDFLSNVWVKRAVSVFNVAYFAVITLLTYATFLYDLEFAAGREKSFFTVYVVINVVFMGLMLFSRRELVTEILSILMLPVVFCMILFNMGDWILIVPPFIVAIIMFFAAGTKYATIPRTYKSRYIVPIITFTVSFVPAAKNIMIATMNETGTAFPSQL